MGVAAEERTALCDLFEELGPDAPTLCEGWATHHLAAHLVVRDSRLDAIPGYLVGGALARWSARAEDATRRAVAYQDLVERLRSGPPLLGPVGVPPLRDCVNVHEYFVHHEDVRRPDGRGPRRLPPATLAALRLRVRALAPYMLRRLRDVDVELAEVDGTVVHRRRRGAPLVRVRGGAGELLLWLFNRRDAAEVDTRGPADATARLAATRLGL